MAEEFVEIKIKEESFLIDKQHFEQVDQELETIICLASLFGYDIVANLKRFKGKITIDLLFDKGTELFILVFNCNINKELYHVELCDKEGHGILFDYVWSRYSSYRTFEKLKELLN